MANEEKTPPGGASLSILTRDWGRISIQEDQVITFPFGLAGFGQLCRYALIERPEVAPFLFLQCLDDPGLVFAVADPVKLIPGYQLSPLNNGVLKDLAATSPQDLKTLVILNIPAGQPREMTANLMAPLIINRQLRQGKQVVLETSQYSHRYRVFQD